MIGLLRWGGFKRCNASLFKFASEAGVGELRGRNRLKKDLGILGRQAGWLKRTTTPGGQLPRIPSKLAGRLENQVP